jgi:adenylate cyclase
MKSKLVMLLTLTAVIAALLLSFRDAFTFQPFQRESAYSNISRVAVDDQGSIYTITDSKRVLQKVNSEGLLEYKIVSSKNARPNTLQLFNSIASDSEGNAYALITVLDSYGLKVAGEQIIKLSSNGSVSNVLYSEEYELSDNLLRVGNIQSLSVRDGYVYFFRNDKDAASLLRLPTEGNTGKEQIPEIVKTIEMPANRYLNELTGNQAEQLFYTTKKGSLFSVVGSTEVQIFPQSPNSQLNFPVSITTRDHANVYFIDYHQSAIHRIHAQQPGFPAQAILTMESLKYQHSDVEWSDFSHITISNDKITVATADQLVQLLPDGAIAAVHTSFQYPISQMIQKIGYWVLILAFAVLLVTSMRFIYVHVLKRKVYLLLKQLAVLIPVVLLLMLGLSYSVYSSFSKEIKDDTNNQLKMLAGNGKFLIDGANLERLNTPRDFMNDDYLTIKLRLKEMFSRTGGDRDGLYNTIYRYMDGKLYIIMDDDDSVTMFQPFPVDEDNKLVLEKGEIVSGEWEDSSGQWMYAIGPLYNSKGDIIGIYETGKDMIGLKQSNLKMMSDIMKMISLFGVILLLVITIMTAYLLSSIRKLRRSVNLIASGQWDVKVQIHTRDEVEELGERFNMMASSVRQYIQEITKLSDTYSRFVPRQFLKVLGKTNMAHISHGEQANRDMTIMVCNMRDFSQFSASLSTEENFRFINSFLNVFGPIIRECGGFTSRYLGAGMLAMFPNGSEAALKAAVSMRSRLEAYNNRRQIALYEPIDIGIAVHSGDVMIGIIGEEQRMEGSVVSNHVQLAMELERLSAKLGVHILLTEESMNAVKKVLPGMHRKLGSFQLGDERQTIELYDLYEGDPEHIRKLKLETQAQFEQAIELFQNGRFYDAREGFVAVVKKNRYDLAAKLYFFACDRYFQEGIPTQWNHALRIS